jgi:Na+/H+ antiporter NhaC
LRSKGVTLSPTGHALIVFGGLADITDDSYRRKEVIMRLLSLLLLLAAIVMFVWAALLGAGWIDTGTAAFLSNMGLAAVAAAFFAEYSEPYRTRR